MVASKTAILLLSATSKKDNVSKKGSCRRIRLFAKSFKDPLLTMILCASIEKQDKGDLGQKGLSDNTKVAFGATKDHG